MDPTDDGEPPDPYRENADPRRPPPDDMVEMRAARAARSRRWTIAIFLPLGLILFVLCAAGVGMMIADIVDGVRTTARSVVVAAILALTAGGLGYAAFRFVSPLRAAVLLVGCLAAAGAWVQDHVRGVRAARVEEAERRCREWGERDLPACVERTVRCIARLDTAFGDSGFVVYLGDPCQVDDPRPPP